MRSRELPAEAQRGRAVVSKRGVMMGIDKALSPARPRKLIKIIGKPKQEVKKKFLYYYLPFGLALSRALKWNSLKHALGVNLPPAQFTSEVRFSRLWTCQVFPVIPGPI
jgi:hypothetical protein